MQLGAVESLSYFVPELILAIAVVAVIVVDLIVQRKDVLGLASLAAVVVSLLAVVWTSGADAAILFNRMIVHDSFAVFFKILIALAAFATIWMSLDSREVDRVSQGEYYMLVLASTLGMYMMATATNLLMAYLALEFVSLTSYVLTGMLRHNRRSGEASLKYLIYGGVASGTMIYGMSWIFGITGSMDYAGINNALAAGQGNSLALFIGVLMTLAGFGYKIAAVPFHMWAPDVYTGAPIPITAFLSVGSKAAGFGLLLRFLLSGAFGNGGQRTVAGHG